MLGKASARTARSASSSMKLGQARVHLRGNCRWRHSRTLLPKVTLPMSGHEGDGWRSFRPRRTCKNSLYRAAWVLEALERSDALTCANGCGVGCDTIHRVLDDATPCSHLQRDTGTPEAAGDAAIAREAATGRARHARSSRTWRGGDLRKGKWGPQWEIAPAHISGHPDYQVLLATAWSACVMGIELNDQTRRELPPAGPLAPPHLKCPRDDERKAALHPPARPPARHREGALRNNHPDEPGALHS